MTHAAYSNLRGNPPSVNTGMTGRHRLQPQRRVSLSGQQAGHLHAQSHSETLSGQAPRRQTITQALAMPGIENIEFDPPRLELVFQPSPTNEVRARHQCRFRTSQGRRRPGQRQGFCMDSQCGHVCLVPVRHHRHGTRNRDSTRGTQGSTTRHRAARLDERSRDAHFRRPGIADRRQDRAALRRPACAGPAIRTGCADPGDGTGTWHDRRHAQCGRLHAARHAVAEPWSSD